MDEQVPEAPRGVFVIDGEECPFPELGEGFDMDEAMVFFEYTGHPIEDLFIEVEADDEEAQAQYDLRLRSPKTMAALMHLAYARKHPGKTQGGIKKLIRQTDFVTAFSKLGEVEDDASPPEMASGVTPPDRASTTSSPSSHDENQEPSGNGSERSSDLPADDRLSTTTSESDTFSTSPPISSAA